MSSDKNILFPPNSVLESLSPLAEMTEDKFVIFKQAVESPEAFVANKARCKALGNTLGFPMEAIGLLLTILEGLYQRTREIDANAASLGAALDSFIDNVSSDDDEPVDLDSESLIILKRRLNVVLVENSKNLEEAKKLARLRVGFIKNALRVATLVDMRPNYADNGESIKNWVPVVQIKITTDSDDLREREIVVQCDQLGLGKLKEAIERAEKKLATLSEFSNRAGLVIAASSKEPK